MVMSDKKTAEHVTFDALEKEITTFGRPEWEAVLKEVVRLHRASILPARDCMPYEFEHIGPGYYYGPAFGHWDIVHEILDSVESEPEHARRQILNDMSWMQEDGFLAGAVYFSDEGFYHQKDTTHPPLWPFAVDAYCRVTGSDALAQEVLPCLVRQIGWYERNRRLDDGGFFYTDVTGNHKCECGSDDSIRFVPAPGMMDCVDACSHVYALYDFAWQWSGGKLYASEREALGDLIRNRLYSEETGFFHDSGGQRHFTFDGFWPLLCGAATEAQAKRVVEEWMLSPERFFTRHPMPFVVHSDSGYELRMWRGPSWNSMTMWALMGCLRYHQYKAVRMVAERVMDATAEQFRRTGKLWEFYHPELGQQSELTRKPYNKEANLPCDDYLGHNPLFAIARMWKKAEEADD